MFVQVEEQGHRHVIMDEIIDLRTDRTQVIKGNVFVTLRSGATWRKDTTKGWQVLVQCKYGSTTQNDLKYVIDLYPVQLAEYSIENGYSDEPAFDGWVKFVMKKHDRKFSNVKSKYWVITHKYGIRVPTYVR